MDKDPVFSKNELSEHNLEIKFNLLCLELKSKIIKSKFDEIFDLNTQFVIILDNLKSLNPQKHDHMTEILGNLISYSCQCQFSPMNESLESNDPNNSHLLNSSEDCSHLIEDKEVIISSTFLYSNDFITSTKSLINER